MPWQEASVRDLREEFVGFLFFLERLFEQLRDALMAQELSERARRAVRGDLVMLHFLRGADDAGVLRGLFEILLQELLACRNDTGHPFAFLGRLFTEIAEDLVEPCDLFLSDGEVLLERLLQLGRRTLVDHFGQCFDDLLFGIVKICQFIGEQLLQRLHTASTD